MGKLNKQKSIILATALFVLVVWNFWVPTATENYYYQEAPETPTNVDLFSCYLAGQYYLDGLNPYFEDFSGYQKCDYPPPVVSAFTLVHQSSYTYTKFIWLLLYLGFFLSSLGILVWLTEKDDRWTFLGIAAFFN